VYFIYKGAPDWPGDSVFGLILSVSVIGGWQHRRLSARVDALTKLLAELGTEARPIGPLRPTSSARVAAE
jgi:hypothetical protein